MSYSYYLIHGLALKAVFLILAKSALFKLSGIWLFWMLLPLMFALTLIPSTALFLLIERPLSLAPRKRKSNVSVVPDGIAPAAVVKPDH